jgi:AcrR family transcriptional regulator
MTSAEGALHAEGSRRRILDAALDLLAEHGYDGTSLQQVADRVGLHKSSLFHHFRSKEELAREVYRGLVERLLKRLEPLLAEDPPRLDTLLAALDAAVDHFAGEPAAARLLMRLMVDPELAPGSPFDTPRSGGRGMEPAGILRVLTLVGTWLARARDAGVIRPVPVRHTILNLMGLVLLYPAVVHGTAPEILGRDPRSAQAIASRKRELREFLRGALAPSGRSAF